MCRESVKMTATVASRYVAVIVFPRPLASYPVKVGSAVSGLVAAELIEVQETCPLSNQNILQKQHLPPMIPSTVCIAP